MPRKRILKRYRPPPNETFGYRMPPADYSSEPKHMWKRLYFLGLEEDYEELRLYQPGGYHPIHLQDELHNGRYRVIHKLGQGGYSTVWLCRDQQVEKTPAYVAVKILMARETGKVKGLELELASSSTGAQESDEIPGREYLCLPLNQFESQSPNGTHVCFVYPVQGPTVDRAGLLYQEDEAEEAGGENTATTAKTTETTNSILRQLSQQTVQALAALHSRGICHADFRPSNILLGLNSLDGLEEEEVLSLLGEPLTTDILIRHDSRPDPEVTCAPKYLVEPVDFEDATHLLHPPRIRVVDFGQAFYVDRPPQPHHYGIHADYAAPEVVLDKTGGLAMDLWSLACTLYEIRLGRRLFEVIILIAFSKHYYMDAIAAVLGRPPEQWAQFFTESESEDSEDSDGSEGSYESGESEESGTSDGSETGVPQSRETTERLIYEKIMDHDAPTNNIISHTYRPVISDAEAKVLADLLEKLLRYNQNERLLEQDVVKHSWFNFSS